MYLHVVSFDIPFPANYGGIIVIFNQIKALQAAGVKVILHCFQYGERSPQPELERYCHEVNYYKRSRSPLFHLSFLPFIMRTREHSGLLKRLRKDQHPILFEGMHTASWVWNKKLRNRQKIVRMHNVEWQYYESLSQLTPATNPLYKAYYFAESIKLQRIEPKVVLHADEIITLSTNDFEYYREQKSNVHYIPPFHPNTQVESQLGRGALWLINEVFSQKIDVPFVIAGMEPSARLKEAAARHEHISLVEDPDDAQMNALIQKAHINLLVTFQVNGVKLKLINALFRGRFCIVNDKMVSGNGTSKYCHVRNSASAIRQTIEALINAPFEQGRIEERKMLLATEFSNAENAKKLISILKSV
jgi:hypothetical protein